MTDSEIIKLYFDRSERAIEETDRAYGKYCRYISFEILRNSEDCEEIVNDTYLKTWESIPPKNPPSLKNYYVGLEYTDAIMNTVRTRCTTYEANESYFKWNEERECWETYSPEWYEIETEMRFQDSDITADETRCEESVDIPREYATETDVEIHCETETGIIECAG